ncbi:MAG: septum formation initiator family protein [Actinomycetota bacterium]|nr:septum formation initiator family protein [Actinomycetota bacterium]MDI6822585.1 septum formation initiator family protein [Actinomycetota bacterium]
MRYRKTRARKGTKPSRKGSKIRRLKPRTRFSVIRSHIVLVTIIVLMFLWALYPLKERLEQKRESEKLRENIAELRAKNKVLKEEIARLKTDDYIEQLARKDLGLIKPGESAYLVVPPKEDEARTESVKPNKKKKNSPSFWERIKIFWKIFPPNLFLLDMSSFNQVQWR